MKRYLILFVLITLVLAMIVGLWPHESMTSSRPAPAAIHRDVDAGAPQPGSGPATTRRAAQGEAQKTLEPVVRSLKLESQAERTETR